MDTKTCPTCKKEFERKAYEGPARWKGRVYCSRECTAKPRRRFQNCLFCGSEFKASGTGTRTRSYCSQRCYHSHRVRENHPSWKHGGARVGSGGYLRRLIYPEHPFYEMGRKHSGSSRDVLEHRLVMAEHIGRLLRPEETVHHINGDREDNRIENLELRVGRHGNGATAPHCRTCTCFGEESLMPNAITIGTTGA